MAPCPPTLTDYLGGFKILPKGGEGLEGLRENAFGHRPFVLSWTVGLIQHRPPPYLFRLEAFGYTASMSTFTETTASITVSVQPTPILEESRPSEGIFVFAYTVTIENNSGGSVQLMERHWVIESADEQTGEVTGPGVVGLQPTLKPGERFEYTSSTVIKDPIGSMRGSYIFRRAEGGFFNAQIPRFKLIYPSLFN